MTAGSKSPLFQRKIDWLLIGLLFFGPRLLNLNVFLTPDEPLFLEYARQFAHGVVTGNFAETAGIGYPGVTVAAWAAPVVNLPTTELGAYVAGRAAIVLLGGVLTLMVYGLAKTLLGYWPAFVGVVLLTLDPTMLGYSRLLHIAAPLALLMTLAGLTLLLWLCDKRQKWLLGVGVFTGLALLTKSTALLLGPMLAVAVLTWGWGTEDWRQGRWWRRVLLGGGLALLVAGALFFILWPAMWINPAGMLELTFGKLFRDQEAGAGNFGMFWLGHFVDDPGPAFYPVAFALKATPWLIIGLALSVFFLFNSPLTTRHSPSLKTQHSKLKIIGLWLFALTYLLLMTVASKKSVRYLLPAWPALTLLAGWGWVRVGESANQRISVLRQSLPRSIGHSRFAIRWLAPAVILTLLVLFAAIYHPYYFTYYNPALLGWRWVPRTLLVGWGEGLDVAAAYLNRQPLARVAAWYDWLFPLYYHGKTEAVVPPENLLTADHTVLYLNQVQRDIPNPNIVDYFRSRRQPEYTARINGIDYAWVYPGPVVGASAAPQPQFPLTGQFANELQLLGYSLHSPNQQGSGVRDQESDNSPNSLIVTLFWRVQSPPPGQRFVFVRLIDERGQVWASTDSPPVMGLWPVTRWQPDMHIEDAQELRIPAGTPPGTYRLEVGVYDPATGRPLAVSGGSPGPGGGLLLGEMPLPWQPREAFEVDLPQPANVALSPNVVLLGYTPPPTQATTGDVLPLELGWQRQRRWWQAGQMSETGVMFEWRRGPAGVASQLDPLPLPPEVWEQGAVLRSQHQVIVPPALSSGPYQLWVALSNGSEPAGSSFLLGTVDVTASPHTFTVPAGVVAPVGPASLAASAATVTLAGVTVSVPGSSLTVTLYWQTDGPLSTRYKVFAQLLNAGNQVVAQSDAVPGQGRRPTTGWLPGEIIPDAHTLTLPADLPPGRYRLIAGLYNPIDGQRLPVLDATGETVADAITVAEVSAP